MNEERRKKKEERRRKKEGRDGLGTTKDHGARTTSQAKEGSKGRADLLINGCHLSHTDDPDEKGGEERKEGGGGGKDKGS